jgi:hypothetical protein
MMFKGRQGNNFEEEDSPPHFLNELSMIDPLSRAGQEEDTLID